MKKLTFLAFILLLVSCNSAVKDFEQIQKTFYGYKNAVVAQKGDDAIAYVDKSTIEYYELTLERARNINSDDLRMLTLFDKLMIVTIRHKLSANEIKQFTGESFLIWSINNGLLSSTILKNVDIVNIKFDDKVAIANFSFSGHKLPNKCYFVKENKKWKMKLSALNEFTDKSLKQMANDKNITHREFIFDMLAKGTGKPVNPEIWERMIE